MSFSVSRLVGIISGIGAAATGLAAAFQWAGPKWAAASATLATIAMFCERAVGGLSVPEKRVQAEIEDRKAEASRL